jgi:hypothetical protein
MMTSFVLSAWGRREGAGCPILVAFFATMVGSLTLLFRGRERTGPRRAVKSPKNLVILNPVHYGLKCDVH